MAEARDRPTKPGIWQRLVRFIESKIKGKAFDCKMCGQCLLSHTRLVCPMRCPKGLRNGPCGGTLDGRCEVYPDQRCVWMEICEGSKEAGSVEARPVFAPITESLLDTSSVVNLATGADRPARRPLPALTPPADFRRLPPQTASGLEQKLRAGRGVLTTEIRSPRSLEKMGRARREIALLAPLADALNATSDHAGVKTVGSRPVAEEIKAAGCEAIVQVCGRDVNPAAYLDELLAAGAAGHHNPLCLTGDWPAGGPREPGDLHESQQRFFRMESAQMIYEARHLRDAGRSAFVDRQIEAAPRLFVGGVINPASTPREVVLSRLAQKIAAGAEFVQTQAVCDAVEFRLWLRAAEDAGLRQRLFILPSVALVGSPRGLEILKKLPGVRVPEQVESRLRRARDIAAESGAIVRQIVAELAAEAKVDGFHFLYFGARAEQVAEEMSRARELLASAGHTRQGDTLNEKAEWNTNDPTGPAAGAGRQPAGKGF